MKKILLLILALAVAVMFSACGPNDNKGGASSNNQSGALMPDTSNNSSGGSLTSDIISDGSMLNPENNTSSDSSANGSSSDAKIAKDKAIDIALNHAGVKKENARDIDAELDRENGELVWDIDFETADTEYSYDINAQTGAITKHTKEPND